MGRYELIVSLVVVDKKPVTEVAAEFGVSRQWVRKLVKRFEESGWDGLEPRSRRPKSSPTKTGDDIIDRICEIHKELDSKGFDAGAKTIRYHLGLEMDEPPSVPTIHKYLKKKSNHGNVQDRLTCGLRLGCLTRAGRQTSQNM